MSGIQAEATKRGGGLKRLLIFLMLLGGTLAVLFHKSFVPDQILFANDGPLGINKAEFWRFPDALTGMWINLNWLGFGNNGVSMCISNLLGMHFSAEVFLKGYAPCSMLLLGFSAWLFFRQLGFGPWVCVVGGIGAGLNMHCFSASCWGLSNWTVTCAAFFLAMAALVSPSIRQGWARAALAGLALGIAVIEGADVGAILSVYFGVFALFVALIATGSPVQKAARSLWMPGLIVVFAMWIAIHSVVGLIGTQVVGIVGTGQTQAEKESRWGYCTAGSLPKIEALRVIIPGVFGYRLDTYIRGEDKSSAYWGRVNEDPRISLLESNDPEVRRSFAKSINLPPEYENALAGPESELRSKLVESIESQMQRRHSGMGAYAGILVVVLAFFGVFNSMRGANTPYTKNERRMVWFWAIVALGSLLLAFGRYAPFYGIFYQLPYVSTIRNPIKFLFPLHIALIVLSGYGLEVLRRCYLEKASTRTEGLSQHIKRWWSKAAVFEKRWTLGSVLVIGAAILTTLILSSSRLELEKHLQQQGFPDQAPQMAKFFFSELFWFISLLAASIAVLVCILSGAWNGRRAKWAWIFLGAIMILDLSHSDFRWIQYYDFNKRYVSNPVIDFLRDKPYEHRVTAELIPLTRRVMAKDSNLYAAYYDMLQNQIPYWNIQTLDIIQMSRTPAFDDTYLQAFRPKDANLFPCVRLWQLTNTRYVLGSSDNPFGLPLDPQHGFVPRLSFQVAVKPWITQSHVQAEDLTYVENKEGPLALFEFTNALPRAKLYANWQSRTNDQATLNELVSPAFDPTKTVLLAAETPAQAGPANPDSDPGTVSITDYHPRNVKLQASAKTPTVLLLNDKFDPSWKAWVDGKPVNVLRCNYIMRGVYVPQGEHTVEFRYQPKITTFYISLSAWAVGVLLAGYLCLTNRKRAPAEKPVLPVDKSGAKNKS